jgi:exosortase/archaeosortase family protein
MARQRQKKNRRAGGAAATPVARVEAPAAGVSYRQRVEAGWRDDRTRFVVAFVVLAGCMLAFYYFPRTAESSVERLTADYLRLYTRMVSWPIRLFDREASAHGNLIAGRFSMQIVKSCDAMEGNILFVSALLAVSAPWRRKAVALLVGLCALVGLNLVRLFVLYWVGVFVPSAFDFLHLDVWPLLMIAFAAADFALCARWTRQDAIARGPDAIDGHPA